MSDTQGKKPGFVRGVLMRLRGAERLKQLAAESAPSTENPELARLKGYLVRWAHHQHAYRAGPERVGNSWLADYCKSRGQTASELMDSDGWAMSIIDAAIIDLSVQPDGVLMRAALRVRYLNEGITPQGELRIRVFRHGRLEGMSVEEADRLADAGELALIPLVKRKGLPL